jgi:aminoglycoside/choline kinase family phosphotransferase
MGKAVGVSERDVAIGDFLGRSGWGTAQRSVLAADASFRRYDRLRQGGQSAVLMDAPPPKEDVRPFLRIARHLAGLGYSAPRVFAADEAAGLLLLEDLGDATFTRLLAAGGDEAELYRMAVDLLIDLHRRPAPADLPAYDEARLLAEAMLLPDWYAPAIGRPLSDEARQDYRDLWQKLLPLADLVPRTLVLRDFHVDNLMRVEGRQGLAQCGLLDFQDAVIGPVTYDLASLLEDARRDVSRGLAADLRRHYLGAFPAIAAADFAESWACLAAQRHAKVVGIFTRLSRRDRKPHYLHHIPRVWRLLESHLPRLAPLAEWLDRHLPQAARTVPEP